MLHIDYVYRYIYPTKHMIYIYRERDIIPTKIYHKKKSSGGKSSILRKTSKNKYGFTPIALVPFA